MFSVSSAEFAGLPVFVEKVSNVTRDTESGGFSTEMDDLRTWCSEHGTVVHYSKTSSGVFYTLKYDRAKLTDEQYGTLGRFRSVVFDREGKICCIAPPKMLKIGDVLSSVAVNSAGGYLHAEEFVEGVMFNLFHHDDKWYVATKSCVGEVSYDHMKDAPGGGVVAASSSGTVEVEGEGDAAATDKPASAAFQRLSVQETLRRRICDTLSLLTNGLEAVPKQYCYSFVLQHPKNQIVNEVTVPKLYLIAVFELSVINDVTHAIRLERDIFSTAFSGAVFHTPSGLSCVADANDDTTATLTPNTVADYCKMYGSLETRGATLPGVVFVDADTGFCYKQRNPKYESVKKRKGMEQKLLSQYLYLRKDRTIDEYLKYHPQHNRAFNEFREKLHDYTLRLYTSYIDHYVKKNSKPLKEYDRELRTHMYKLHYDVFLATMKETGAFVTKHTVINYVNNLAPAQQLACLNLSGLSGASGASGASEHQPENKGSARFERGASGYSRGGSTLAARGGFRTPRGGGGALDAGARLPTIVRTVESGGSGSGSVARGNYSSLRGAKSASAGVVKVQNRFSSLNSDETAGAGTGADGGSE
jgi:hypothetical protein